jgi:hypothetical protein
MTERTASILEHAISRAQTGETASETLLWVLAAGEILFLNEGEPQGNDFPSSPFVVHRDDQTFLALFTHADRIGAFANAQRFPVSAPAWEILRRTSPEIGVVVNPGHPGGFDVPAESLHAFVTMLATTKVD